MTAKLYAAFDVHPLRCSTCNMKFAVLSLFHPNDGPDAEEDQRSTEWTFMHAVNTLFCPYCGQKPVVVYDKSNG